MLLGAISVSGAAAPPVEPRVVNLWPDGSINNPAGGPRPNLEIFSPFNPEHGLGAVVVILPGGGYAGLSPYERLDAEFFRGLGYTAVVVNYRVAPNRYPAAYADAVRAIRLVRRHAVEWGIPAARLALLGGSAGGHLAALVATQPDLFHDPADDLAEAVSARPDRLILLYPVILTIGPDAHVSIDRLLGPNAPEEQKALLAPERHVTRDVPPTLIFHAADDPVVKVENSLVFARACWAAGVPAELHVFPRGGHGKDFAYDADVSPKWRALTQQWLAAWLASSR
jgi:acetyl esterase/lipase